MDNLNRYNWKMIGLHRNWNPSRKDMIGLNNKVRNYLRKTKVLGNMLGINR